MGTGLVSELVRNGVNQFLDSLEYKKCSEGIANCYRKDQGVRRSIVCYCLLSTVYCLHGATGKECHV